jgi:hypothetical protein
MRPDLRTRRLSAGALVALPLAGLLAGCGQPYSNEDLRFLAALPEREQLEAHVPGGDASHSDASHSDASHSDASRSDASRSDALRAALTGAPVALALGEEAGAYRQTRQTGDQFNAILTFVLGVLDEVRRLPATTREEDRRTWGPFPWNERPGFEGRVVITRVAEDAFRWSIEFRRRAAAEAAWSTFIQGEARTTTGFESSSGTMLFPVAEAEAAGLDVGDLAPLQHLGIVYDSSGDPRVVSMDFLARSGDRVTYTSRRAQDGSGALAFRIQGELVQGPAAQDTGLMTTRWDASGAGRSDLVIVAGDGRGAQSVECWGTDFLLTYQAQNWPGGTVLGDATSCVP